MSTCEQGEVAEDDSPIDEARLEAILKVPQLKAALLKKMGLGDEANKDQHPTPSGTSMGGWKRAQSKWQRGKEAELPGQIVQPVADPSPQTPLQTKIFGATLVHIPQLESLPEVGRATSDSAW